MKRVSCHYAPTDQIAAAVIIVVTAISVRITAVGVWPIKAKTAKPASMGWNVVDGRKKVHV